MQIRFDCLFVVRTLIIAPSTRPLCFILGALLYFFFGFNTLISVLFSFTMASAP